MNASDSDMCTVISELCGWDGIYKHDTGDGYELLGIPPGGNGFVHRDVPDYVADGPLQPLLDGMAPEDRRRFAELMTEWYGARGAVFANNAQRCAAYIKVMGVRT